MHKAAAAIPGAAAQCLERINLLSSNLFCFQLMRIDAYPRLCILRVWLLSMARFNYSLPSHFSLPGSAILFLFRCRWPRNIAALKTLAQEACTSLGLSPQTTICSRTTTFKYVTEGVYQFACSCLAGRDPRVSAPRSC